MVLVKAMNKALEPFPMKSIWKICMQPKLCFFLPEKQRGEEF